jgi:CDP-2,3-bis-(O-geranylgeranyl)-sn-glycerol synthase
MIFILNVCIVCIPLWIVNGGLNFLYPLKQRYPYLSKIDRPIDTGAVFWDGRRLFGDSTTILGIVVALTISFLLTLFIPLDYFVVFLGAYGGHMIGSFIKRRMGKSDGEYVPVIDHGDAIITLAFLYALQARFTLPVLITSICITLVLYPLVCKVAYTLKLRKYPR